MERSGPADEGDATTGAPADRSRQHRRWIWISALLAIVAAGLAIWALTLRSDRDDTQQQLDETKQALTTTEQQLDTTKQQLATAQQDLEDLQTSQRRRTGLALLTGKVVYDKFAAELGATRGELAETQQDVANADQAATQAEQDAAAAEQDAADAETETAKAKAQADQAKAESRAAQSRADAAKGCARAYIEAFGGLFDGDDPRAQAATVRKDLQSVTDGCKTTLADAQSEK